MVGRTGSHFNINFPDLRGTPASLSETTMSFPGIRRLCTRRDVVAGSAQGGLMMRVTRLEHDEYNDSPIDYTEMSGLMTWMRLSMVCGSVKIGDFLDFTSL